MKRAKWIGLFVAACLLVCIVGTVLTQQDEERAFVEELEMVDDMTQRNSALVEQTAAASESLKDRALHLETAVSKFRVTEQAA